MTKQYETKLVPLSELNKFGCAWDGCRTSFTGDMPKGWVWLTTYWGKTPIPNFMNIPAKDSFRDTALCPTHAALLEEMLKKLPDRRLDRPAGEA